MNKTIRTFCCFWMAAVLFLVALPAKYPGREDSGLSVVKAEEAADFPAIPYGQDITGYDPERDGYYGLLPIYYEVPGSQVGEDASKTMATVCLPVLVYQQLVYAPARLLPEVTGLSLKTGASGLCLSCWERKLYLTPGSDEAYYTIGKPNLYGSYYSNMKFHLRGQVLDYEGETWIPLSDVCLLFDLKPHLLETDGQGFLSFYQTKEDVVDVLAGLYADSSSYIYQYSVADLEGAYVNSGLLQVINGLFEGDTDSWAMFLKSCIGLDEWAMEGWEKAMTEDMVLAILETGTDEAIKLMGQCYKAASDWFSFGSMAGEKMADITRTLAAGKVSDISTSLDLAKMEHYSNALWYDKMYDAYFSNAAFAKEMWETSDSLKRFGEGLDIASFGLSNLIGIFSYWEAFWFRDKLAASALEKVMEQREDFLHLGEISLDQMEKTLKELEGDSVTYSVYHYIKDNFPSWIVDGASMKCPPLALYRLAMHLIPYIQDGVDSTRSFQVSMYAIPFQLDARNVLLKQLEGYDTILSTPEQRKESVELAYAFLKTCYAARNLAISAISISGRDQTEDIAACTKILEHLAVLSAAYREDASQIYIFHLPDAIRDLHRAADASLILAVKPMYLYAEGEVKDHGKSDAPVEDAKCEITSGGELLGKLEDTKGGRYAVYVPTEKTDRLLPVEMDFTKEITFSFTSPTVPGEDSIQTSCKPKEELCPMETAYLNAIQQVIVTVSTEEIKQSDFTSSIISPIVTMPGKEDIADAITNHAALKSMVEAALSGRDDLADGKYGGAMFDNISMFYDLKLLDAYCAGNALSMQFMLQFYNNGLRPISERYSHTFDLETGEELTLSALLEPENEDAKEALIALLTQALNENTVAQVTNPEEYIRRVFDGKYSEQAWQFSFSKDGLQITFSPYVIDSYFIGYIEASVPYERLNDILRKEYLPAQYKSQEAKGNLSFQAQEDGSIAIAPENTLLDVCVGTGYNGSAAYRDNVLYYSNTMGKEEYFLLPETETNIFIAEYHTKEKGENHRTGHAVCITVINGIPSMEPVTLVE